MKYVMFSRVVGGTETRMPVIFPNFMIHADVAVALLNTNMAGWTATSAGDFNPITNQVGGKSLTLGLEADPIDALVISTMDYAHGIVSAIPHAVSIMAAVQSGVAEVQSIAKPKPSPGWSI